MSQPSNEIPTFPREHADAMRAAVDQYFNHIYRGDALPALPWRLDAHMDANEANFIAMQLLAMRPGIYKVEYPALKAKGFIPWNTSVHPGAEEYGVDKWDGVGEPLISRDYTTETPMVETSIERKSTPIFGMRLGYQYSLQEAQAAIFSRQPLNERKAMKVREEMERKLDDIAFVGEAVSGVKGLFNQTGTTTYTPKATGTGGSKKFDDKAPDDILLDLNEAVSKIVSDTKEVEIPDQGLLPLTTYNLLTSKRVGDGTSSTILAYFVQNQPFVKSIEPTHKLETAGASSTKRMVFYRKDPTRLEMIVPLPFQQLAPQSDGFVVKTLCHMRTAGVAVYLPKSICYSDDI